MKTKKVNRYYCDFCRKSGCSSGHIREHEKTCVDNPNRECRLCGTKQRDYPGLVAGFKSSGRINDLRLAVERCPACILAVIRQAADPLDGETRLWEEFNYSKERDDYLNEKATLARVEAVASFVRSALP